MLQMKLTSVSSLNVLKISVKLKDKIRLYYKKL